MAASIIFKDYQFESADDNGNISTEKRRAAFYFTMRIIGKLPKTLGCKGLYELGERMKDGDLDDFVKLAWLAHETASFVMRKPLEVETIDDMYMLFTPETMTDMCSMVMDGLVNLMESTEKGVKEAKKKPMRS